MPCAIDTLHGLVLIGSDTQNEKRTFSDVHRVMNFIHTCISCELNLLICFSPGLFTCLCTQPLVVCTCLL